MKTMIISTQDIKDRLEQIAHCLTDLQGPLEISCDDPDFDNVLEETRAATEKLELEETELLQQLHDNGE